MCTILEHFGETKKKCVSTQNQINLNILNILLKQKQKKKKR